MNFISITFKLMTYILKFILKRITQKNDTIDAFLKKNYISHIFFFLFNKLSVILIILAEARWRKFVSHYGFYE